MIYETNHYGDDEGTAQRAAQRAIPDLGKKIVKAVRERAHERFRVIDREDAAAHGLYMAGVVFAYAVADFAPTYIYTGIPELVGFGNDFELMVELANQFNGVR